MSNSDQTKDLIIAFLSGALAGGAISYLIQTEKGKELINEASELTRAKIKESKETLLETELDLKKKLLDALDKISPNESIEDVKNNQANKA